MRPQQKTICRIGLLAYLITGFLAPWIDGCGASPSPNNEGVSQRDKKSQDSPNIAPNSQAQRNEPPKTSFLDSYSPSRPSPTLQNTATHTSTVKQTTQAPVAITDPLVGYGNIIQALLSQHCTACHSTTNARGGILLDSYGQAVRFYQASLRAIQNGTMPRGNPLTAAQKKVFQDWGQAKFPK